MISQRFILPFIKTSLPLLRNQKYSHHVFNINLFKYNFSQNKKNDNQNNKQQLITYVPIRPLKKHLTALYIQKDYLNKGKVAKKVPFWPYLSVFYAMTINNFLTTWSFVNTAIASVLFLAGVLIRQFPNERRTKQIIKLQCIQDMSKLYITVPYSLISQYIRATYPQSDKQIQQFNIFTEQQLKYRQYVPTEQQKKTLTEEQIELKKRQYDDKLVEKIIKSKQLEFTINRIQLDTSKTLFKLSNNPLDKILDHEVLHPEYEIDNNQITNAPYKFLIVRTQYFHKKRPHKPFHFYIDLQQNGDLKYQDYLVAMGANYKISLASQAK